MAACWLSAASIATAERTVAPGYVDSQVAEGLEAPVGIAFLPDGQLLVVERFGHLTRVAQDGSLQRLGDFEVCGYPPANGNEMGLVGVAVDPDFAANGRAYLYLTRPGPDLPGQPPCSTGNPGRVNEVVAVEISGDEIVDGSEEVLLSGIATDTDGHIGGGLRIGPDGKLYVGVGDANVGDCTCPPGGSTNPYSQDLSELAGKVLRLDLDGGIPSDNPFVGDAGVREEIFAYGLRNPWRFDFDPRTGSLWLGDVGQRTKEEIDIVSAGGNYGWPLCEGLLPEASQCGTSGGLMPPGGGGPLTDYVPPVFSYGPPDSYGSAVMGGSFADLGSGACAASIGSGCDYYFADYAGWNNGDKVYRMTLNGARDGFAGDPETIVSAAESPVDVITGPDGAIYYAAAPGGEIRRVGAEVPPPGDDAPVAPGPPQGNSGGSPPLAKLTARKSQRPSRLAIKVRVDSDSTLTLRGRVNLPGRSRTIRFRTVHRTVAGGATVELRLPIKRARLRLIERALRHGSSLRARISLVAANSAGEQVKRATIALRL